MERSKTEAGGRFEAGGGKHGLLAKEKLGLLPLQCTEFHNNLHHPIISELRSQHSVLGTMSLISDGIRAFFFGIRDIVLDI